MMKEEYCFYFTIVFHSEHDYTESGLGFAADYLGAMEKIQDYYGDELISIEHIEFIGDSPNIFPVSPETIRNILKEEPTARNTNIEDLD